MDISELLDTVDAAIFSGDALFTDRELIKYYLERWSKAVIEDEIQEMEDE